jgi:hypothetical protein
MLTIEVVGRRRTVLLFLLVSVGLVFFGFLANVTIVVAPSYTGQVQKELLAWDDLRPRNLRIAFIGDSLTRFQYISLVYYLKTGNWTAGDANLFDSHRFKGWNEWIAYSIDVMKPNEHCDCYRGGDWTNQSKGGYFDMINENRYYRDEQGNHVTYLCKFQKTPVNGHWKPQDVYDGPISLDQDHFTPYSYRYNWSGAIEHLLGNMNPKPEFVVFNSGLHFGHDLGESDVQQSIIQALNKTGITGIYKTTTHTRPEVRSGKMNYNRQHDHELCHLTGHCLNMSWTLGVPLKHYNPKDKLHYDYKVNKLMNGQLLNYLKYEFHPEGDRPSHPVNISTLL